MICSALVALFLTCSSISEHEVYQDAASGDVNVIAFGIVYNFGLPGAPTVDMIELDFDADEQFEQFIEDSVATVDP